MLRGGESQFPNGLTANRLTAGGTASNVGGRTAIGHWESMASGA